MCKWTKRIFTGELLLLLNIYIAVNVDALESNQLDATFNTSMYKSGPIFLHDSRTIFISLFEYKHHSISNIQKKSRWFKATTDDGERLEELYFIHHDNRQTPAELTRDYHRENVYLRVGGSRPDITSLRALVIVKLHDEIVASVNIPYETRIGLDDTIDNPLLKNDRYLFRYPKCCPIGTYADEECRPMEAGQDTAARREPIHLVNGPNFDNESLANIYYQPFVYKPDCDMFVLDSSDERYMLITGQLLSALPDYACMDFIADEVGLHEVIFMCASTDQLNAEFGNNIYVGLMYVSGALLLLWASLLMLMFMRNLLTRKTLPVLTILYSVFYALHFITLAVARQIGAVSDTCKIMGYIYQFLLLSSFMAMFAMIFESYYRVKHYNEVQSKSRVYFYLGFCAVPIITTLISVLTNEMTLSTTSQFQRDNACWFRSERKVYSYYVPIICIIFFGMMVQLANYFNIKENHREAPALFRIEEAKFRNMFRLGAYLNGIMTFCWGLEVLAYCFEAQNNFWFVVDMFNSTQGLAIIIAFSYHYYDQVWKILHRRPARSVRPHSYESTTISETYHMEKLVP